LASRNMAGKITPLALELTDPASISDCANTLLAADLVPDTVICNAGIYPFGSLELVNGVEKVFFANFLGHFALIKYLLPAMQERGVGSFVHVSSDSAYKQAPDCGIDFANLRGEGVFHAGEAYGRSKLANALFSLELADRLKGTNLRSNALHPGSILTNISHAAPFWTKAAALMARGFLRTVEEGASTQVYVATHPDAAKESGCFFAACKLVELEHDHLLANRTLAHELWQVAEDMLQHMQTA
ncbi:MAG TPA: oxidoreductase, partial [Gammaproteobacteria bacterium]|nr:oxidoreductase [Gammaproteobacteria bacterium]